MLLSSGNDCLRKALVGLQTWSIRTIAWNGHTLVSTLHLTNCYLNRNFTFRNPIVILDNILSSETFHAMGFFSVKAVVYAVALSEEWTHVIVRVTDLCLIVAVDVSWDAGWSERSVSTHHASFIWILWVRHTVFPSHKGTKVNKHIHCLLDD